jgi:phenylalanyl-tRNA synthetase alpha chain
VLFCCSTTGDHIRMDTLSKLSKSAQAGIANASSLAELDLLRVFYLGKRGVLTERLRGLGFLPSEQRREAGQAINNVKQVVETAIADRRSVLEAVVQLAGLYCGSKTYFLGSVSL